MAALAEGAEVIPRHVFRVVVQLGHRDSGAGDSGGDDEGNDHNGNLNNFPLEYVDINKFLLYLIANISRN